MNTNIIANQDNNCSKNILILGGADRHRLCYLAKYMKILIIIYT